MKSALRSKVRRRDASTEDEVIHPSIEMLAGNPDVFKSNWTNSQTLWAAPRCFISDAVYEGRLQPEAVTSQRYLRLSGSRQHDLKKPGGLLYVPVPHENSTYECGVEAEAVRERS